MEKLKYLETLDQDSINLITIKHKIDDEINLLTNYLNSLNGFIKGLKSNKEMLENYISNLENTGQTQADKTDRTKSHNNIMSDNYLG
jgi:hypothetical protein